jgi:ferritin-like metal-binding protein YciE
MELDTLRELYVEELKDLHSAETQLVKALPKMEKAATNPQLKRAFAQHLRQTERHVARLERIFRDLDESPRGKKCVGMEGLVQEGQELIKEKPEPAVLDAGLISKAQHVEHYEMAGYGTVRTYAETLGEERHVELLQQTLEEEEETDRRLSELAENSINIEAAAGRAATKSGRARTGSRGTTSRATTSQRSTAQRSTAQRPARREREVTRRGAPEGTTADTGFGFGGATTAGGFGGRTAPADETSGR